MLGQLDTAGRPEVGVGLGMAVLMAIAIAPAPVDDIVLVALMTPDGVGIGSAVVVLADLQFGMYLAWSL